MEEISNILLIGATCAAAFYCFSLSRRLRKFTNLESGMGGAIAVLSAQVNDLHKSVEHAKLAASQSQLEIEKSSRRAEEIQRKLDLQIASLHDLVPVSEQVHGEDNIEVPETSSPDEPMFVRRRAMEEG